MCSWKQKSTIPILRKWAQATAMKGPRSEKWLQWCPFWEISTCHINEGTQVGEVIAAKHVRGTSCRLCIWQMEGGFVIVVDFIETKFKLLGGKSFPACRKLNEIRWKISEKTKWTQKAEIENKNTVRRAFFYIDLRLCPIPNAATNTQVQWNLSPCLWAAGTYKVGYIRAVGALNNSSA